MYYFIFFFILILKYELNKCEVAISGSAEVNLDVGVDKFSITRFISELGYPVEVHVNIPTEDDYLLDMQRIPSGRNTNNTENKPAVLLMHGLLGSAENWIINGPDKSLAFLLADMGYDVWLGNARGSTHSRKHLSLNPDTDDAFWRFSWHEIGVYDLPAMIDYIIEETNQTEIYYIGHSQGTTSFFVMASELPSYNGYIKLMIALAPVVYTTNLPHPGIKFLSIFSRSINFVSNILGRNEFIPNNDILKLAGQALCQVRALIQELCVNVMFLISGYDSEQLDRSLVPLLAQTSPAGASIRQLYHYGQGIQSGEFQQYDYGFLENLNKYGSSSPPRYDLSLVSAPVALFYGANDWLISLDDVERLASELPNLVTKYLVPYPKFNHLDFIFATDVVELLYNHVFEVMNEFNNDL